MAEEENNSLSNETDNKNLPVVVQKKNLLKLSKYKSYDALVKISKILGATVGCIGGASLFTLVGGPIAGSAGLGILVYSFGRGIGATYLKSGPGLMFTGRKIPFSKETKIGQDPRIDVLTKMRGYNNREKAGMILLQSLVGFQRFKENLEESPYYQREDGKKVYTEIFSTKTHGSVLQVFKLLQDLDIIELDPDYKDFKDIGKKSFLILEKICFGNFKGIIDIAKSALKGDKEKLENIKEDCKEVRFRLTDKKIDFEEMYKKYNGIIPYQDKAEEKATKKIGLILFKKNKGLLSKKNLDIGKDITGRTILKYGVSENFGTKIEKKIEAEKGIIDLDNKDFSEKIHEGITKETIERTNEIGRNIAEKSEKQEIIHEGNSHPQNGDDGIEK